MEKASAPSVLPSQIRVDYEKRYWIFWYLDITANDDDVNHEFDDKDIQNETKADNEAEESLEQLNDSAIPKEEEEIDEELAEIETQNEEQSSDKKVRKLRIVAWWQKSNDTKVS